MNSVEFILAYLVMFTRFYFPDSFLSIIVERTCIKWKKSIQQTHYDDDEDGALINV